MTGARQSHVHRQPGGIVLHCEDSDCEQENQPQSDFGDFQPINPTHPPLQPGKEKIGELGNVRTDSGQPFAGPSNSTPSPWLSNCGNFSEPTRPLKMDLILPRVHAPIDNNIIRLDESDCVPVSIGWGFSLLGFFIGRFPGKDAITNLTKRWSFPVRISYHQKGWIIFRFEKEEHANNVLQRGPYSVFGIHLALSYLPDKFRFDSSPELQFKVWVTLPNLPLELWNASAISKIASAVGIPLEVDPATLLKNNVTGPRVLVLIDAKNEPLESITLQFHDGTTFSQALVLDFFPFFCTGCRRAGHLVSACRATERTNLGTRMQPRNQSSKIADDEGWRVAGSRKNRAARSISRQPTDRSKSRGPNKNPARSKSRPPVHIWQPKNQKDQAAPATVIEDFGTSKPLNTHTYLDSPTSSSMNVDVSNKFQVFDGLEQVEETLIASNQPHTKPQIVKEAVTHNEADSNHTPAPIPPAPTHSQRPISPVQPVLRRISSTDTLLTECIPLELGSDSNDNGGDEACSKSAPNDDSAAPNVKGKQGVISTFAQVLTSPPNTNVPSVNLISKKRQEMAAKAGDEASSSKDPASLISANPSMGSQGFVSTFAQVLTSPPNNVASAGTSGLKNKEERVSKILDPRNAIKKNIKGPSLPPGSFINRVSTVTKLRRKK